MRQVWQTADGEVFEDEGEADDHERRLACHSKIADWVHSRNWSDQSNAAWLLSVLKNNYCELRDFLNELP